MDSYMPLAATNYLKYQECHLVSRGMWRGSGCDICHLTDSRLILLISRLLGSSFLPKCFTYMPLVTSSGVTQAPVPGNELAMLNFCFLTHYVQLVTKSGLLQRLLFPKLVHSYLFHPHSLCFGPNHPLLSYWKDLYTHSPVKTRNDPSKIQISPKLSLLCLISNNDSL